MSKVQEDELNMLNSDDSAFYSWEELKNLYPDNEIKCMHCIQNLK